MPCMTLSGTISSTLNGSGANGNGSAEHSDRAVQPSKPCSAGFVLRSPTPIASQRFGCSNSCAAGLPEPVPQFRVWISPTQWYDLDFAWPWLKLFGEFDPYKWHGNRDKYEKDAKRRLRLRLSGWDGVSVTDDELDAGAPLAIPVLWQLVSRAS